MAFDEYSFAVVFRKGGATGTGPLGEDSATKLARAWEQRDELARRARMLELKVQALERSRALRLSRVIRRLIGG